MFVRLSHKLLATPVEVSLALSTLNTQRKERRVRAPAAEHHR